jgi:L-lactate dehydrogenase complex protein LldF
MVTTLPRVHIALMGMERIVPTLDDLALMLRLLPRSATGQKLTVYTSLLNGPRRGGDPDGPSERHVIIVDNGRRRLRETPLAEMLYCIRCGACLNACPVFREIGGHAYVGVHGKGSPYPGPMGSVLAPGLFGQAEFGQLARASSLCGACKEACPVDIDLPKLLLRVRAGMTESTDLRNFHTGDSKPNPPGWLAVGLRLFTWAAEHPGRFRLAQKLAGTVLGGRGWLRLPAWSGWGSSKDFPQPAKQSFQERWARRTGFPVKGSLTPIKDNEHVEPAEQLHGTPPAQVHKKGMLSLETRLEMLQSELEALGAQLIHCNESDAVGKVLELLQTHGCQEIMAWESSHLPKGMLESLQQAGIRVMHPTGENIPQAGRIRVGLTGAIAAAAETGSVAIPGGSGRPLIASLLPEVHIAVVREGTVLEYLDDLLQLPELRQAAAAVLVSGPSRTADIEMTLTIGVHGPGELIVIVC